MAASVHFTPTTRNSAAQRFAEANSSASGLGLRPSLESRCGLHHIAADTTASTPVTNCEEYPRSTTVNGGGASGWS
jgi:hypothetical protein